MYRTVAVALLLLVGGCAGTLGLGPPPPEASKVIEKARTVGVISAVGHKFALQKIGITVFGNELNEVPIGSWGIDNAVTDKIGALLSRRFTVRRIALPKGAFAESDDLQDVVRKVAASQKYDLYLVVTRGGQPFGSTNQVVSGVGMVEHGGALLPDNVTLFAVTAVHLYDGRTFERLHWRRVGFDMGTTVAIGGVVNAPHRKLDRSWWPATPQAAHSEKLKSATRTLLTDGLAQTVPELVGLQSATSEKKGASWSPFKP
jgi:hypothetical protein